MDRDALLLFSLIYEWFFNWSREGFLISTYERIEHNKNICYISHSLILSLPVYHFLQFLIRPSPYSNAKRKKIHPGLTFWSFFIGQTLEWWPSVVPWYFGINPHVHGGKLYMLIEHDVPHFGIYVPVHHLFSCNILCPTLDNSIASMIPLSCITSFSLLVKIGDIHV